jgi:hypothetical protein
MQLEIRVNKKPFAKREFVRLSDALDNVPGPWDHVSIYQNKVSLHSKTLDVLITLERDITYGQFLYINNLFSKAETFQVYLFSIF